MTHFQEWFNENGPPKHLENNLLNIAEQYAEKAWAYKHNSIERLFDVIDSKNKHIENLKEKIR